MLTEADSMLKDDATPKGEPQSAEESATLQSVLRTVNYKMQEIKDTLKLYADTQANEYFKNGRFFEKLSKFEDSIQARHRDIETFKAKEKKGTDRAVDHLLKKAIDAPKTENPSDQLNEILRITKEKKFKLSNQQQQDFDDVRNRHSIREELDILENNLKKDNWPEELGKRNLIMTTAKKQLDTIAKNIMTIKIGNTDESERITQLYKSLVPLKKAIDKQEEKIRKRKIRADQNTLNVKIHTLRTLLGEDRPEKTVENLGKYKELKENVNKLVEEITTLLAQYQNVKTMGVQHEEYTDDVRPLIKALDETISSLESKKKLDEEEARNNANQTLLDQADALRKSADELLAKTEGVKSEELENILAKIEESLKGLRTPLTPSHDERFDVLNRTIMNLRLRISELKLQESNEATLTSAEEIVGGIDTENTTSELLNTQKNKLKVELKKLKDTLSTQQKNTRLTALKGTLTNWDNRIKELAETEALKVEITKIIEDYNTATHDAGELPVEATQENKETLESLLQKIKAIDAHIKQLQKEKPTLFEKLDEELIKQTKGISTFCKKLEEKLLTLQLKKLNIRQDNTEKPRSAKVEQKAGEEEKSEKQQPADNKSTILASKTLRKSLSTLFGGADAKKAEKEAAATNTVDSEKEESIANLV